MIVQWSVKMVGSYVHLHFSILKEMIMNVLIIYPL